MTDKYSYDLQPIRFRKIKPKSALHENNDNPLQFLTDLRSQLKPSSFFPIIERLKTVTKDEVKSDVMAGLLIGAFLIPQGMAYATVAGLCFRFVFVCLR